jgi:vacuolar-type H+-ATPase subunit H
MTNHETLVSLFDTYLKENEKFTEKGVKAAGTRARTALAEFTKAAKERRKEIQDSKTTETKE